MLHNRFLDIVDYNQLQTVIILNLLHIYSLQQKSFENKDSLSILPISFDCSHKKKTLIGRFNNAGVYEWL